MCVCYAGNRAITAECLPAVLATTYYPLLILSYPLHSFISRSLPPRPFPPSLHPVQANFGFAWDWDPFVEHLTELDQQAQQARKEASEATEAREAREAREAKGGTTTKGGTATKGRLTVVRTTGIQALRREVIRKMHSPKKPKKPKKGETSGAVAKRPSATHYITRLHRKTSTALRGTPGRRGGATRRIRWDGHGCRWGKAGGLPCSTNGICIYLW